MKIQKGKDGFTLIEIIIAINVAFIAITLIISVYIILDNVFISSTIKIEEKNLIGFSFNNLNEMLRKEKYFMFSAKKDTMEINFNSGARVIFTSDLINIKDLIFIKGFSQYSLKIHRFNKTESLIKSTDFYFYDNLIIHSNEIRSIEITLMKNTVIYKSIFNTPLISDKRFENI
jgi:hypothetical protein